jgi:hypothetical protein
MNIPITKQAPATRSGRVNQAVTMPFARSSPQSSPGSPAPKHDNDPPIRPSMSDSPVVRSTQVPGGEKSYSEPLAAFLKLPPTINSSRVSAVASVVSGDAAIPRPRKVTDDAPAYGDPGRPDSDGGGVHATLGYFGGRQ